MARSSPGMAGSRLPGSSAGRPCRRLRWLDEAIRRRTEAQEDVTYFAEKYRKARDEQKKALWLEEWHFEQRMFDILNDLLPERYKAKLENRSYREGASRAGEALKEIEANPALRAEYIG